MWPLRTDDLDFRKVLHIFPFLLLLFFVNPNSHMTQSFAWSPGFVVRLCACQQEPRVVLPITRKESWMFLSSTWPRVRCSTGVRLSLELWLHTPATAPTTWWPATAEGPWSCKTSVNSSLCVWCKSPCSACCRLLSCSGYFFSDATWWSNRKAWLTFWWRTGDPLKTWKLSWSVSASVPGSSTVENYDGWSNVRMWCAFPTADQSPHLHVLKKVALSVSK